MSVVSIHQPGYFPWIGFFHKIAHADTFVLLDTVQFEKNYFDNRNKIRTPQGWMWLTIPVHYRFGQTLNEISIDMSRKWIDQHRKAITMNYGKCRYFSESWPGIDTALQGATASLADLNCSLISTLCTIVNIPTVIVRAKDLPATTDDKTERLLSLCKNVGADRYLSGQFGKGYLNEQRFAENGVAVEYQRFEHPQYPQRYPDFIPEMSIIDLLFNVGPQKTREILCQN